MASGLDRLCHAAFTLIELLAVIAVISVLAAVLFPVLANARKQGNKAVAISNMRQCLMSLNMYADDNGDYPMRDEAVRYVPKDVTWDPSDDWRSSPNEDWFPLLGSFGYINQPYYDVGPGPASLMVHASCPHCAILASIFYTDPPIPAFRGEAPPLNSDPALNPAMPKFALAGYTDSSVKWAHVCHPPTGGWTQGFVWGSLFLDIGSCGKKWIIIKP